MLDIRTSNLRAPYDPDADDLMVLPIADEGSAYDRPLDAPAHSLELVRGGTRYAVRLAMGSEAECQAALAQVLRGLDAGLASIHLTHPPANP